MHSSETGLISDAAKHCHSFRDGEEEPSLIPLYPSSLHTGAHISLNSMLEFLRLPKRAKLWGMFGVLNWFGRNGIGYT